MPQNGDKAAFAAKSMDEVMKALGGGSPTKSRTAVTLKAPDIAENGAVVPVGIITTLKATHTGHLGRKESQYSGRLFELPKPAPNPL